MMNEGFNLIMFLSQIKYCIYINPMQCNSRVYLKDKNLNANVKTSEWPPSSPNCNSLDYFLWDKIKAKVYEDSLNVLFQNEEELKMKIKCLERRSSRVSILSKIQSGNLLEDNHLKYC